MNRNHGRQLNPSLKTLQHKNINKAKKNKFIFPFDVEAEFRD